MPRRTIRRLLPKPHAIRDHKSLRLVSARLHDPNLWHLNRHSVSVAAFVGVFVAFIPVPMQMLIAAAGAIWLRCNITLAVALVWLWGLQSGQRRLVRRMTGDALLTWVV